jgi:hypothetical protein
MKLPVAERRRAKAPAAFLSLVVAGVAGAMAWFACFGLLPLPNSEGTLQENLIESFSLAERAAGELASALTTSGSRSLNSQRATSPQFANKMATQFFGRILLVLIAGAAAAAPVARWRYERTPRRLGTIWLGTKFPLWSEGSDAIANLRLAMSESIRRTGLGLQIAPGAFLSREYEARAILAVGDPGSGKTVAFWHVIFQLLRRRAHLILHDVKGDLTERWPNDRFILLAPHDERSLGWAIGRDIVGEILAREFAAQLIVHSERSPNWPAGAQEILVGVILTLQQELGTRWGWSDLKAALDLADAELREFASRHNKAAARFLALGEEQSFTLNASSYVATLMAPINRLIAPIAKAWGDLSPKYQISLRAWLDNPNPDKPVLILQRAADLPSLSKAWIGAAIDLMTAHLLATRRDSNPADRAHEPDCWFLLDEFAQIGLDLNRFLPLFETGRSLGLRGMIGLQNFGQLASGKNSDDAGAQLRQLAGCILAFQLAPGPDAAKIANMRLTNASVRTWIRDEKAKVSKPSSEEIPILTQSDLAALKITRDGALGYLVHKNAAFGLTWPFPQTPKQRAGTMRAQRLYE